MTEQSWQRLLRDALAALALPSDEDAEGSNTLSWFLTVIAITGGIICFFLVIREGMSLIGH